MKIIKNIFRIGKRADGDFLITRIVVGVIGVIISIALIPATVQTVNSSSSNLSGASLILTSLIVIVVVGATLLLLLRNLGFFSER